jgi:CheY-like chemotaxis protein
VESTPGAGTTFTIYLPRSAGKETSEEGGRLDVPRGSGQTILVAEDDRAVRQTIVSMLERLDYRVLAAENGKEALQLFDRHDAEVDILLTDLVMPEVGGLELASRLRQTKPSLATIVMSGYAMSGESEIQPSQEVDAVLKKPVSLTALAGVLEEITAED